jgi:signal transduction histidine kinase
MRWSVRSRLTVLYSGLFLASGAALLAITYVLVRHAAGDPVQIATTSRSRPAADVSAALPDLPALPGESAARRAQDDTLHQLLLQSGVALGIMVIVAIALGWVVAGRALAPVRMIASKARQISQHNLNERLALNGPADELRELGDTVDDLLARLEQAFDAQRRFVANASHEMRTPLAMMRTSLDVAAAKATRTAADSTALDTKLREGLDRAERLMESFLTLARAEHGRPMDEAAIPLDDLIRTAVEDRSEEIAAKALDVQLRLAGGRVPASEGLLRHLVENLVDNAIRHNDTGGWIRISTDAPPHAGIATLSVENSGPIIDQRRADDLATPFRRLADGGSTSTTGVGLGLSIVAAVADAHGGSLQLHARVEDGGGLRAVVELPLVASPQLAGAAR